MRDTSRARTTADWGELRARRCTAERDATGIDEMQPGGTFSGRAPCEHPIPLMVSRELSQYRCRVRIWLRPALEEANEHFGRDVLERRDLRRLHRVADQLRTNLAQKGPIGEDTHADPVSLAWRTRRQHGRGGGSERPGLTHGIPNPPAEVHVLVIALLLAANYSHALFLSARACISAPRYVSSRASMYAAGACGPLVRVSARLAAIKSPGP